MVGTSQAAPHVAGAAALLLAADPTLTGTRVVELLKLTAVPIGGAVPTHTFGSGRLDVAAAVSAARGVPTTTPTIAAVPTRTSIVTPVPATPSHGGPSEPSATAIATRTATPNPGSPTPTAKPVPPTAPVAPIEQRGAFRLLVPLGDR